MLKIWGRSNSVNVKKALWCIEELGLPYERTDAGLQFGVVNTPAYRKMNPNGLVPTMEEDGFILWESHSIVRYLAAKYGKGVLWPMDERTRAVANQWMDWAFTFQASVRDAFWGLVRTPPEKRDMNAIREACRSCAALLAVPEQTLSSKPYLAGSDFTMADIPLGCHVQLWFRLPIERPRLPSLEAWFGRLLERPAYRAHVDLPPT